MAKEKAEKSRKFNKKHLWWIIPLTGVFCLMIVQFFWPESRARPFYSFGGENIFMISKDGFVEKIQGEFSRFKIVFDFMGEKLEIEASKVGASIDSHRLMEDVFSYPISEKIVPFSIFKPRKINEIGFNFDDKTLDSFLTDYVSKREKQPIDASLALNEGGEVVIVNDVEGLEISKKDLKDDIKTSRKSVGGNIHIRVNFKKTQAKKKASGYLGVKELVEKKINQKIYLSSVQKIYTPNRQEIASWISFEEKDGMVKLSVKDEKIKKYVDYINTELEIPAEKIQVDIVDGREKSRTEGKNGKRVSFKSLREKVLKYLNDEIIYPNIILEYEDVRPTEHKNYSYTNTQDGLQAKVNEIGSRYNVRLSLKQLNGAGWEANYRENESTPSASTYKLYVALKLFDEINKGALNWDSAILGTNTRNCFHQMIGISTNHCAEAWIKMFGRTNINNFIYNLGISRNTTFTSYDATRTTARDLRVVTEGIYNGSLASGENRGVLLHEMSKQIHRKGIPSGSAGRVFDKVGFLWDYVHDTAAVEHPRGTYVVSIMTKGANYSIIAQIVRELEAFMYP